MHYVATGKDQYGAPRVWGHGATASEAVYLAEAEGRRYMRDERPDLRIVVGFARAIYEDDERDTGPDYDDAGPRTGA